MKNYVIYRVACTIQLLLFFFLAVFAFHPNDYDVAFQSLDGHPHLYPLPLENATAAVVAGLGVDKAYGFRMSVSEYGLTIPESFNLPVIALVVIVILNDATIISIAYDHVKPSILPERWNLPVLFAVAGWIGAIACGSSLLLLHWALSSEDPSSPIRWFGVSEPLTYGQVVAMMYLKISLSDWWTIFAARTQGPFWSRAPSRVVFAAASLATLLSTLFSCFWPFQHLRFDEHAYLAREEQPDAQLVGLHFGHVVFTWIYTIVWFLVQDGLKVAMYKLLHRLDVCGIRTEAEANAARVAKNQAILAQQAEATLLAAVESTTRVSATSHV